MSLFKRLFGKKEPDFDTIEGINAIKIPKSKPSSGMQSPVNNIEYILQRKATQHKKNGRMDLAIACLRKSNEIMPHSNIEYSSSNYLRLVSYLKLDGQKDEAQRVDKDLRKKYPLVFCSVSDRIAVANKSMIAEGRKLGFDLVQFTSHYPTCAQCSLYQGRVFSISGSSNRYPKLPKYIIKSGRIHDGCKHILSTFFEDTCSKDELEKVLSDAKLPLTGDLRSEDEIALYNSQKLRDAEKARDAEEYEEIKDLIPEFAPKSFSGYRRMKKSKSKNFIKLLEHAKNAGIKIGS